MPWSVKRTLIATVKNARFTAKDGLENLKKNDLEGVKDALELIIFDCEEMLADERLQPKVKEEEDD